MALPWIPGEGRGDLAPQDMPAAERVAHVLDRTMAALTRAGPDWVRAVT